MSYPITVKREDGGANLGDLRVAKHGQTRLRREEGVEEYERLK